MKKFALVALLVLGLGAQAFGYSFAARTNGLSWLIGVPNAEIEWGINDKYAIAGGWWSIGTADSVGDDISSISKISIQPRIYFGGIDEGMFVGLGYFSMNTRVKLLGESFNENFSGLDVKFGKNFKIDKNFIISATGGFLYTFETEKTSTEGSVEGTTKVNQVIPNLGLNFAFVL